MNDEPLGRRPKGKAMINVECLMMNVEPLGRRPQGKAMIND